MTHLDKGIKLKLTPGEYAQNYQDAVKKIRVAYDLLQSAHDLLQQTFGGYGGSYNPLPKHTYPSEPNLEVTEVLTDIQRRAWLSVIDVMQIKKIVSNKRWDEIMDTFDKTSKSPLPDLTELEIINLYQSYVQNADMMFAEAVREAWDFLTPGKFKFNEHKSNPADAINCNRIVLVGILSTGFVSVSHYYQKHMVNLDKVFHTLDGKVGKHLGNGYQSVLVDAINQNWRSGETDYFGYKGYKNGNLHLSIKRPDLVDEMALILKQAILKTGEG